MVVVVVVVVGVDNLTRAEPVVVSQPLVGDTLLVPTQQQTVMVCHGVAVTNTPGWLSPGPYVPTRTGEVVAVPRRVSTTTTTAFWGVGQMSPLLFGGPR